MRLVFTYPKPYPGARVWVFSLQPRDQPLFPSLQENSVSLLDLREGPAAGRSDGRETHLAVGWRRNATSLCVSPVLC